MFLNSRPIWFLVMAFAAAAAGRSVVGAVTITAEPSTQAALPGMSPAFTVNAAGDGALTYQWNKDGNPIAGATAPVLRLSAVKASDAGNYAVTVSASSGKVTSSAAALKVLASAVSPAPALPAIPNKLFNVTANGALADAATDNTVAIQKTIDAAIVAGGGYVEIPAAAKPYLCGPLKLGSHIALQIDAGATVQLLPYAAQNATPAYPIAGARYADFVTATNAHDVAIVGGGTIDGAGAAWWTAFRRNAQMPHRPFIVRFSACNTILVSGITVMNSPMFHVAPGSCNNLTLFGLKIRAPENAPNTDGIDPSGSHQLIQNCDVAVGDDNIAVKAGGAFCSDITIADCVFGTGHGVSVGGQSNRGLDGMVVKNCIFNGTTSGLRLKADPTQGGVSQNITYTDLTMNNVQYPIVFYSYYKTVGGPGAISGRTQTTIEKVKTWNAAPPNSLDTHTMPVWKNITLNNVTATGAKGYNVIFGLPRDKFFIDNVVLHDVHISGGPGFEIYDATNIQFTGTTDVGKIFTCNSLAIIAQPKDQAPAAGGDAEFTVNAAGTSGVHETAPAYQWNLDGKPLADGLQADKSVVSGATTPALKIARAASPGKITVTVSSMLDGFDVEKGELVPGSVPVSFTSGPAALSIK